MARRTILPTLVALFLVISVATLSILAAPVGVPGFSSSDVVPNSFDAQSASSNSSIKFSAINLQYLSTRNLRINARKSSLEFNEKAIKALQRLRGSNPSICNMPDKEKRESQTRAPQACSEFKFPKDGILTLHNGLDDLHHYGRLGKKMGDGIFGIVYDITGSWSTHTKEHVVAKWFKFDISPKGTSPDQNPAIQEILNLQDVHELVDYGLMIDISSPNDVPHTWAILKWKNGVFFDELPEFKTIIQGLDRKKCEDLMEEAREAIVEASRKYIRLPGAPSHTDIHMSNVLFFREKKSKKLRANLIDWGTILWRLVNNTKKPMEADLRKPTKNEEKTILNTIRHELRIIGHKNREKWGKGHYDFTTNDNCFQPVHEGKSKLIDPN